MPTDRYEFFLAEGIIDSIKWLIKNIFPGFYRALLTSRFRKIIYINDTVKGYKILANSLHTKYSVLNHFSRINEENIEVYYSPLKIVNETEGDGADLLKSAGVETRKFFLMVSGNRWIKNPCRALRALDNVSMDKKVVITGATPKMFSFLKLKNRDRFVFLDYVSDSDLEILYKNAFALVYPTLNEGFGYPPLEAMKYGTYTISSAVSSITEIYGDSLLYFNPYLIDEMENRITMLLKDAGTRKHLSARMKKKYKEITEKQTEMLERLCKKIME
jgi:glycosyltransferase involved in cell wall biosynthesis